MAMKRIREFESLDMAKCLIFLSENNPRKVMKTSEIYECKTCNKKFTSFQALGGHRASHKKPKLTASGENKVAGEKVKAKKHECSICGIEFALGQALGGHMRRHRAETFPSFSVTEKEETFQSVSVSKLPVLRRLNSSKRVFGLDLNLTPLENDLEYLFGKMAPKLDHFL
ncbi:zinc finger protein ZAT11 [Euphorbia lathyris]|uniref:zinc finger protein ZAT11 n=1 Tax=Euphorbia lathyris TaxID=212925 RepID=UPI003313262D